MTHEIVGPRGERLHDGDAVPKRVAPLALVPPPHGKESPSPHDGKVDNHGHKDAKDGPDIAQDRLGLLGKDDDDCVEQADERERRKVGEKFGLEG